MGVKSCCGCKYIGQCAFREFCSVHSWQNGTRCRNVLIVWLILRVSSLNALVFIQKTFLHTMHLFPSASPSTSLSFLERVSHKQSMKV